MPNSFNTVREINYQIFASQMSTCCSLCVEQISMKTQLYVWGYSHCFHSVLPNRNIRASEWGMVGLPAAVQLSVEIMTFFKLCHFSQLRGFCYRIQIMPIVKSVLNTQATLKLANVSFFQQPFYCGYAAYVLTTDYWNLL